MTLERLRPGVERRRLAELQSVIEDLISSQGPGFHPDDVLHVVGDAFAIKGYANVAEQVAVLAGAVERLRLSTERPAHGRTQ